MNCHSISGVPERAEDALWGTVRALMGDSSTFTRSSNDSGLGMDLDTQNGADVEGGKEKQSDWGPAAQGLKGLFELTRGQLGMMQKQQIRPRDGYEDRKQRGVIVTVIISGAEGLGESYSHRCDLVREADVPANVEGPVADTISSLIKQDAKDNVDNLVRVNGIVTGPMIGPGVTSRKAKGTRLGGRLTTVDEVVDLAVFLCSEKSSFINGQVFGEEIKK